MNCDILRSPISILVGIFRGVKIMTNQVNLQNGAEHKDFVSTEYHRENYFNYGMCGVIQQIVTEELFF